MKTCIVIVLAFACVAACERAEKFSKYKRKSMTMEAVGNLKAIYNGARTYYEDAPAFAASLGGAPPPAQFPNTAALTPELGACCKGSGKKCAPNAAAWATPSWQALRFSIDDPHYYSYEFISQGTGLGASFTARAYGDLDCDGEYSTFEMTGSLQPDGTVTGSAGLFRAGEFE